MERAKKIIRKTLKVIAWLLGSFIGFALLWIVCAGILSRVKVNTGISRPASGIEIFIRSNGVHTDFVVPVNHELIAWDSLFPHSTFENVNNSFQYIAFGWGDKQFYIETPEWKDLKFSTAFKAVFWLGEGAMHVTYYRDAPPISDRCKSIMISKVEYARLIAYIKNSFEREDGKLLLIDHPGYSERDNFYEAKGTFSFLQPCNEWTGDGLEEIGVEIGTWTPLESGIMQEL